VERRVADQSQPDRQPSAARPWESTDLAAWLVEGRGLLEDIRTSLDTRYPTESEEEPEAETPPRRGIGIALAAFVPTFLLVFVGLPYVLSPTSAPPAPVSVPLPSATRLGPSFPVSLDRVAAPLTEFPATLVSDTWVDGAPALASQRDVEPMPVRSGSADTGSWARAAAFADDRAAGRLAATMRSHGYRVDLRREDSATLPWVVWISKPSAPSRFSN
jgi:hypothetical protein